MNTYFIFNFAILVVFVFVISLLVIWLNKKDGEMKRCIILSGISAILSIVFMWVGLAIGMGDMTSLPIVIETPVEPQIDTLINIYGGCADSTYIYTFYQIVL